MNLINRDELLEWIDKAELTPDGGIDINDLKEKLETMPVLIGSVEYAMVKELRKRLARKAG
jgi:hypothetical protein